MIPAQPGRPPQAAAAAAAAVTPPGLPQDGTIPFPVPPVSPRGPCRMMSTRQQNRKKLIHALAEICGVGMTGLVFSSDPLLLPLDDDGFEEEDDEEEEEGGLAADEEEDEDGLAPDEEEDEEGLEDDDEEEEEEEGFAADADGSEGMMLKGSATAVETKLRKARIKTGIAMRCRTGEAPVATIGIGS